MAVSNEIGSLYMYSNGYLVPIKSNNSILFNISEDYLTITVKNNYIEDMGWGIYANGGAYNTIDGNTLKNCGNGIRCNCLWAWYPTGSSTCSPEWGYYWSDKNFDGTLRGRTFKLYPYYLDNAIWTQKYGIFPPNAMLSKRTSEYTAG